MGGPASFRDLSCAMVFGAHVFVVLVVLVVAGVAVAGAVAVAVAVAVAGVVAAAAVVVHRDHGRNELNRPINRLLVVQAALVGIDASCFSIIYPTFSFEVSNEYVVVGSIFEVTLRVWCVWHHQQRTKLAIVHREVKSPVWWTRGFSVVFQKSIIYHKHFDLRSNWFFAAPFRSGECHLCTTFLPRCFLPDGIALFMHSISTVRYV